jgi:UDP-GlcNAc3NAcA epimerase
MKIVTIVGARPQFIKAAALSRALKALDNIKEIIIHTGQHFDRRMSDIFFEEMDIPLPNYNLAINSLSHGAMTGRMLEGIEVILLKENPDFVLVYGDTNSTLSGALAAAKLNIPVVHIEAGLRSFNMEMPEEINRILTDRLSSILFCPTDNAIFNLKKEGFEHFGATIVKSGDVMEDSAIYYSNKSANKSDILQRENLEVGNYFLCTIHRAENTNSESRMRSIVAGLNEIANKSKVIIPLHPRTREKFLEFSLSSKIHVIEPAGYFDMIELIKNSKLVITDSGGLQKEAYFFNKFCVTLREQTEWIELVENGYNKLVGSSSSLIVDAVNYFQHQKFYKNVELYGGGTASEYIARYLLELFRKS